MNRQIEIRVVRDNAYQYEAQRNKVCYDVIHYVEVDDDIDKVIDRSGCLISFTVLPTTTWGEMEDACTADATAHGWL